MSMHLLSREFWICIMRVVVLNEPYGYVNVNCIGEGDNPLNTILSKEYWLRVVVVASHMTCSSYVPSEFTNNPYPSNNKQPGVGGMGEMSRATVRSLDRCNTFTSASASLSSCRSAKVMLYTRILPPTTIAMIPMTIIISTKVNPFCRKVM